MGWKQQIKNVKDSGLVVNNSQKRTGWRQASRSHLPSWKLSGCWWCRNSCAKTGSTVCSSYLPTPGSMVCHSFPPLVQQYAEAVHPSCSLFHMGHTKRKCLSIVCALAAAWKSVTIFQWGKHRWEGKGEESRSLFQCVSTKVPESAREHVMCTAVFVHLGLTGETWGLMSGTLFIFRVLGLLPERNQKEIINIPSKKNKL